MHRKSSKNYYAHGDYNVSDDRFGLKVKRSECRFEWTGRLVRKVDWEQRHPQDLIQSRPEHQHVEDPRPRPSDYFLSANEVVASDL